MQASLWACVTICTVLVAGCCTHNTTVNLDALRNNQSNPVAVRLCRGSYTVTVFGIADGGQYDAWRAWTHAGGKPWINEYAYSSPELGTNRVSDGVRYPTESEALANARTTYFTLSRSQSVRFYLHDPSPEDNGGGMSLRVKAKLGGM